jgi:hypothetical protein
MTMASGNFISSTGTNLNLYVTWSSTTNVSTNTSSVTAKVYMRSYTISGSALADSYISINGNKKSFAGKSLSKTSSSLTDTLLAEHTVSVAHNSDGKKSITIKANLEFNGTVSGKYLSDITASRTVDLDAIPRASGLSVATSVSTGSSLTATITPANSAFTHKISYIIGNTTMFTSDTIAAGTKTYTRTIEHSWLPKLNSTNMVVRLFTFNGSTQIGVTDKTVTVSVPASIIPTVSSLTTTVVNGLSGYYVEGKSQVKLTATATAGSGSTLSSYVFSGANVSGNASTLTSTNATVTSSVIKTDGSVTYSVIAKDGRPDRQSAKKETSITVYPYANPQITSITAQRCLADGTLDSDGTYAKVTVKTSHSSVNGANKRVLTLYSSKDNYATGTVVLASTDTGNIFEGVYGSGFNTTSTYTIRAVITDSYNSGTTIQKSTTLKVAERAINIAKYGNGVSIGGLSTVTSSTASGLFEVNWPVPSLNIQNTVGTWITGKTTDNCIVFNNLKSHDNYSPMIKQVFPNGDVGNIGAIQANSSDNTRIGFYGFKSSNTAGNTDASAFLNLTDNSFNVSKLNVVEDISFGTTDVEQRIVFEDGGSTSVTTTIYKGAKGSATILGAWDRTNERSIWLYSTNGSFYINRPTVIDGSIITSNNQGFRVRKADGTDVNVMRLNTSNNLIIGEFTGGTHSTNMVYMGGVYNSTIASSANLCIGSNERIYRSTSSSQRYKTDIQDIQTESLNPEKLYDLPVREFKFKEGYLVEEDPRINTFVPGFIAEEVAEIYPIACEYDNGEPENWNIRFMVPAMLKLIQDQKKEIEALKEQINNKAVN